MPREWPFIARFAGWRTRCAPADARRLLADAADAFVDRAPVDWRALQNRSRTADDRAVLENLRALDGLRQSSCSALGSHPPPTPLIVWLVIALAAAHVGASVLAIAVAWLTGVPSVPRGPQILLALAFSSGAVVLGATSSRDPRRALLLATFACAASAFARGALSGVPHGWGMRGLWAEMFLPACLWRFALDFPRVRRFTRFDVIAGRVTVAAWLLGGVVCALNIAVACFGVDETGLADCLPNHRSNLFWRVFTTAVLLAIGTILVRSRRAPAGERARVARFALALAACASPFLLLGIVRTILPVVDGWLRAASPPERLWLDSVIVAALAAMPLLSTAVVVVDRPFELPHVGARPQPVTRIALWFFGGISHAAEYQRWVARGLDDIRTARGTREIAGTLERLLARATGAAHVSVLAAGDGRRFRDRHGGIALAHDSVIVAMLHEAKQALDLSAYGSILSLLPRTDRDWSIANAVDLAAPIVCRDGSIRAIVLLGHKSGGARFNRGDRWLVRSLAAAAAVAWETATAERSAGGVDSRFVGELAFECPLCGVVSDAAALTCSCGREAILAALPLHLAGTFLLLERLGAGGMGVVYRARDTRLGRDVALKTLTSLNFRRIERLRSEAQAMAALNHEALATIYGLEFFHQTPVLVVEYLPGRTLAHRVARRLLTPKEAVRLGIVIARALAYMHDRGVLHRDLKPSNIGFTARGEPKLLDFGLATLFPGADDRVSAHLAGTLAYLPPEALRGAVPNPSFDLWALALVLLESLTGVNPFASDDPSETARRILHIDSVLIDSPVELQAFFSRALAPSPDARYRTSREFQRALITR